MLVALVVACTSSTPPAPVDSCELDIFQWACPPTRGEATAGEGPTGCVYVEPRTLTFDGPGIQQLTVYSPWGAIPGDEYYYGDGDAFDLEPTSTIGPGGELTLDIEFRPTSAGVLSALLVLQDSPYQPATIALVGTSSE